MTLELSTMSSAKLEPFLLMAKSAKGAGAAKLIQDATAAQGVFVFGELLDMPNVRQLEGTEHAPSLALLRLFAYGTYDEYLKQQDTLPSLNQSQTTKLRLLTLVSLSFSRRIIPYKLLLETLKISSIRELEDLIIDGIYMDILRGKLDQKSQQFEVEFAIGRDLTEDGVKSLLNSLQQWSKTTSTTITSLDAQLSRLASERVESKQRQDEHEATLFTNMKELNDKYKAEKGLDRGWGARGPPKATASAMGLTLSQQSDTADDLMEIDEPKGAGVPLMLQIQADPRMKFKNAISTEKPRKRNKF